MSPLDGTRRHMVDVETQICATCGSRVAGLCRPLDVAALDEMSSESDQMSLPARSTVFREGDPAGKVFTLMDGTAKLTRLLPDGKQQVVGFRFAGDIIGYTTRDTYPFDAELLTDARLCRLDRSRLSRRRRSSWSRSAAARRRLGWPPSSSPWSRRGVGAGRSAASWRCR